ncbi:hypothetical protein K402DRAFT_367181 [Aulographum hederae CBS 113979]|uniref:Uncharacterized protein n=1 Tax=Aulographum hederae CBS 113979 TaxID=1176131 RepID=A0A6G1HF14_9PEZI|nr:hypothetical protein K402DRAFT_367181 [Aulographum hederae CBS 113979]
MWLHSNRHDSPLQYLSDQIPFLSSTIHKTPIFKPGIPKLPGSEYSRALIIAATKRETEEISWIAEDLPNLPTFLYVVDDPAAPFHVPKNKGHEVMVYLTYVIDNYYNLSDVNIFMHAHRFSWHNNELLNGDAVEMLTRLNPNRVIREGYMNMRCHWDPGCPVWLRPNETEDVVLAKQEQQLVGQAFAELFPLDEIPETLSQPCCAQFAVSGDRLRQLPLDRYIWMRDWLLRTELTDYIAGRVFEYTWQYVFTGQESHCPSMHVCYCDGFGVCFKGEKGFDKWFELKYWKGQAGLKLDHWELLKEELREAERNGTATEDMEWPKEGEDEDLRAEIDRLEKEMGEMKEVAMERGKHARIRAMEAGREWKEGGGF